MKKSRALLAYTRFQGMKICGKNECVVQTVFDCVMNKTTITITFIALA